MINFKGCDRELFLYEYDQEQNVFLCNRKAN